MNLQKIVWKPLYDAWKLFRRYWLRLAVIFVIIPAILIATLVRFSIEGVFDGIYLLKGTGRALLEVKDEIFLGEYERLIAKIEYEPLLNMLRPASDEQDHEAHAHITYRWNERQGRGFIQSRDPDGSQFITCFGRFVDSNGKSPQGLFMGGGLPYSRYAHETVQMNETGMAYFDSREWFHLWCNANEGIAGANSPDKLVYPSDWEFLGSRVPFATNHELIIHSRHRAIVDQVPFRIDRYALYRAGEPYLVLAIRITNVGQQPAGYFYVYGDEPWVGDYGTSIGNVGWTKDRLLFYEALIDPKENSFVGMYDYGNRAINEKKERFSRMANFIEWIGMVRPQLVYVSNKEGKISDESQHIPLDSPNNRVLFLQWGPRLLTPGQSDLLIMAIGMAGHDPKSDIPVKPEITIDWDDLNFVLTNEE